MECKPEVVCKSCEEPHDESKEMVYIYDSPGLLSGLVTPVHQDCFDSYSEGASNGEYN